MPTTGSTSTGYARFIIVVIICSSSMAKSTGAALAFEERGKPEVLHRPLNLDIKSSISEKQVVQEAECTPLWGTDHKSGGGTCTPPVAPPM